MEIYAVTDSCITGKLTGVKDPHFVDAPDYDGAFFAIPCH